MEVNYVADIYLVNSLLVQYLSVGQMRSKKFSNDKHTCYSCPVISMVI